MLHIFVIVQAAILGMYLALFMFTSLDTDYIACSLNPFVILIMIFVGVVGACALMAGVIIDISTTLLITWLCTWAGSAMASTLVIAIVMSCID